MRHNLFLMVFFVLLVLTPYKAKAQGMLDDCINYFNEGNYQKAIEAGKKAIKLYPNNFAAHHCLGIALYNIGEINLALQEIKAAKELATSGDLLEAIESDAAMFHNAAELYRTKSRSELDKA